MRFEFDVEHGTEEGGEEMVTLGKTGKRVYRRLRVRALATDVRELLLITRLEGIVKLQDFFGASSSQGYGLSL